MNNVKNMIDNIDLNNLSIDKLKSIFNKLICMFDYVENNNKDLFYSSMKNIHECINGYHFNKIYAEYQVSLMQHKDYNNIIHKGEIFDYNYVKSLYDSNIRKISNNITVWDVYVALNATYHDYIKLYRTWFKDENEDFIRNKIIENGIEFWFKDDDSSIDKIWKYFK